MRSQTSSPHLPTDRGFPDSPKGQDVAKGPSEYPRQHSPLGQPSEPRGSSPFQEVYRGPSPVPAFPDVRGSVHGEVIRGPFPNPGKDMYRCKGMFRKS